MKPSRLTVRHIVFTGPTVEPAELEFDEGCNLIWGASNTGKSFTLKTIDFMLGGSKSLPDIEQRKGYDTVWLGMNLSEAGDFTLSRAIAGGDFALYEGLVKSVPFNQTPRLLSRTHSHTNMNNLSNFLLEQVGLAEKLVAIKGTGKKQSLSFRDLAHISIADETAIQADDRSPIEGGQLSRRVQERSVFRLLLTGADDSAIIEANDPKKEKEHKSVKIEFLDQIVRGIEERIDREFPDSAELQAQDREFTILLESLRMDLEAAQESIGSLIGQKETLGIEIPETSWRVDEIKLHLARFKQLNSVYISDIDRLEALEEAGFLVSLAERRQCPLCGAEPGAQSHLEGVEDVEKTRSAVVAEIAKIKALQDDLRRTVGDLQVEQVQTEQRLAELRQGLAKVERRIDDALPAIEVNRNKLSEVLATRDRARAGLVLLHQRDEFLALSNGIARQKIEPATKSSGTALDLSGTVAQHFCDVVARVLTSWEFPGKRHVSFNKKSYDIEIDGKLRTDNGKGVRAITHAAFKVALLVFCRENELPHPGFVVLDTPLLTYRDPLKQSKYGALMDDEKILAESPLKERFFEYLFSIRHLGQFIVFENVELPANIDELSRIEVFAGGPGGREGLFPSDSVF